MKRQIAFAAAFAASVAAGAAAQTQMQQPGSPGASAQIVTVTGCVQSGELSGSTSTAGSAAAAPSFILANPTMAAAG